MTAVKIKVKGAKQVADNLGGFVKKRQIAGIIDRRVGLLCQAVLTSLYVEAPEKRGHLKKSFRRRHLRKNVWGISEGKSYGAIQRAGAKAHIIRPVNKQALTWPGGPVVKLVRHPGFPANPYPEKSIKHAGSRLKDESRRVAIQIVAELSRRG